MKIEDWDKEHPVKQEPTEMSLSDYLREKHRESAVFPPLAQGGILPQTKPTDIVNHPPHYTEGKVECIDALESATTGLEGIEAVCTANAIKYLWRWKHKNGVEDLKKSIWYINRLIQTEEQA